MTDRRRSSRCCNLRRPSRRMSERLPLSLPPSTESTLFFWRLWQRPPKRCSDSWPASTKALPGGYAGLGQGRPCDFCFLDDPGPYPRADIGANLSVYGAFGFVLAYDAGGLFYGCHVSRESQRRKLVGPSPFFQDLDPPDQTPPLQPYGKPRAVPAGEPKLLPDLALQ